MLERTSSARDRDSSDPACLHRKMVSIEQDAFCSIIPNLASQLQIDTGKLLANKLCSQKLLSTSKWKHNLSLDGGGTEQKGNDLLVALQTEIEVDNNKVYELIRILKDLQDYEAIGKQLEGTEIRFYTASALCISECVLVCQRV